VPARRDATARWPATPSSPVGDGVKRRSRSPVLAANSQSSRTATAYRIGPVGRSPH